MFVYLERIVSALGCSILFQVTGPTCTIHANPETFLVLSGSGVVKSIKGEERTIKKNEVVFFAAKDYYQITNTGTEPLVLFGNRSEGFGGPHIKADGTDRNARA